MSLVDVSQFQFNSGVTTITMSVPISLYCLFISIIMPSVLLKHSYSSSNELEACFIVLLFFTPGNLSEAMRVYPGWNEPRECRSSVLNANAAWYITYSIQLRSIVKLRMALVIKLTPDLEHRTSHVVVLHFVIKIALDLESRNAQCHRASTRAVLFRAGPDHHNVVPWLSSYYGGVPCGEFKKHSTQFGKNSLWNSNVF